MQALPGFPLIAGKVIPTDFDRWRMMRFGLNLQHRGDRLRSAVDTTRELKSTSDSRVSWLRIENSLKAAVESLGLPEGNGSSDV